MDIAEKIIVTGDITEEAKNDLAYLLMNFKAENEEKDIKKASFIIKHGLESAGYTDKSFTLSESNNYIRLEVHNGPAGENEKRLSSVV